MIKKNVFINRDCFYFASEIEAELIRFLNSFMMISQRYMSLSLSRICQYLNIQICDDFFDHNDSRYYLYNQN